MLASLVSVRLDRNILSFLLFPRRAWEREESSDLDRHWSPNLQIWTCLNQAGLPLPRSQI
jgi:hypothetical protein